MANCTKQPPSKGKISAPRPPCKRRTKTARDKAASLPNLPRQSRLPLRGKASSRPRQNLFLPAAKQSATPKMGVFFSLLPSQNPL